MDVVDNCCAAASGSDRPVSRSDALSQSVVHTAIGLLELRHGMTDHRGAWTVLRNVSERHDVPLRALAAALVSAPPSTWSRAGRNPIPTLVAQSAQPPRLSFTPHGHRLHHNRSQVMRDVLEAAMHCGDAERGTVQLRDPVYRGLAMEDQNGFDPDFVEFFDYVDDADSACGYALRSRGQTIVGEIDTSPVFSELARAVVTKSEVGSVVSTPLRDRAGAVHGVVSVHYSKPHAPTSEAELAEVRHVADECGCWLHWYTTSVLPAAVTAVHAAAARVAHSQYIDPVSVAPSHRIGAAGRVLMDRYDIDAPTAAEVLVRLADRRSVSVGGVVAQLLD